MKHVLALVLCMAFLYPPSVFSAHIEKLIDLTIKVEDPSFNVTVKDVSFDGQEIPLDAPNHLNKLRKATSYRLLPGRYVINWTTEKTSMKRLDEKPQQHERILVLESGDATVRVCIKGDILSLY